MRVRVRNLELGDAFMWAGHEVVLLERKTTKFNPTNPQLRLRVRDPITCRSDLWLGYYANETITRVRRAGEERPADTEQSEVCYALAAAIEPAFVYPEGETQ